MNRRDLITLIGGAAAWPVAARAQQPDRVRQIGMLMRYSESDSEGKVWLSAFMQGLSELGWTDGRNMRMDVRWAGGDVDRMRTFAKELVDLRLDLILANSTPTTAALQRETRTIPIVFVAISDPVGSGFVAGLPHPGGNLTGLINLEASVGGKWLEVLTEVAPGIKRAAMMFNPNVAASAGLYYLPSFNAAAGSLNIASISAPVHSDAEIETVITSLGREPGGGLVVSSDNFTIVHRALIIMLAARNNVPAMYWNNVFPKDGGLISYGADEVGIFRHSAFYVDRILRGEKPADMPVEVPTKYEMVLNLKTARALGLNVPQSFSWRADELIE
jgi:putative tryptophan/tyrosine transport system substrate-binding protein